MSRRKLVVVDLDTLPQLLAESMRITLVPHGVTLPADALDEMGRHACAPVALETLDDENTLITIQDVLQSYGLKRDTHECAEDIIRALIG